MLSVRPGCLPGVHAQEGAEVADITLALVINPMLCAINTHIYFIHVYDILTAVAENVL